MEQPGYALDPFYLSDYSDTDSDDSEPIDEQEIYGEILPCFVNIPFSLLFLSTFMQKT